MRILSGGGPRSVRLTGIGDPQGIILPSALKRPLDRAGDIDRRERKEHLRGLPESWVGPSGQVVGGDVDEHLLGAAPEELVTLRQSLQEE